MPIPAWAFLGLLALGSYIFLTLLQWGTGGYPVGTFNLFHAFFAASIPYMLGLLRYLDQTGDGALGEMRPALRVNEAEFAGLRYRLTTLPRFAARSAGLLLVMTVLTVLAIDYLVARLGGDARRSIFLLGPSLFQVSNAPLSLAIAGAWLLVSWWMSATVLIHSIHQLRTINEIYTRHTEVDIFRLGSLYALSRHTLRTAIGILLFLYAFVATAPGFLNETVSLVSTGLMAAMAVLVFALPLVGVYRTLVHEKERQLDATAVRLKSGLADLHRRVDQRSAGPNGRPAQGRGNSRDRTSGASPNPDLAVGARDHPRTGGGRHPAARPVAGPIHPGEGVWRLKGAPALAGEGGIEMRSRD